MFALKRLRMAVEVRRGSSHRVLCSRWDRKHYLVQLDMPTVCRLEGRCDCPDRPREEPVDETPFGETLGGWHDSD